MAAGLPQVDALALSVKIHKVFGADECRTAPSFTSLLHHLFPKKQQSKCVR
ncbi:Uncharacterised protein [Mycobacteroides abscessus subsp. bolletii]|nr:Uncharacterised protein [Mycobacteroides abscessus subsp. bolletii]